MSGHRKRGGGAGRRGGRGALGDELAARTDAGAGRRVVRLVEHHADGAARAAQRSRRRGAHTLAAHLAGLLRFQRLQIAGLQRAQRAGERVDCHAQRTGGRGRLGGRGGGLGLGQRRCRDGRGG
jgi:hypothetical protein